MAFAFRRTEYLAITLGAASGSLVFAALPISVGAVITVFGDPAKGGIAATAELSSMAIASLLVGTFLRSLPARSTAIVAALILIAGYALSSVAIPQVSWPLLLFARVLVGAGEGALYTISNAFAAKSRRPDRTFTGIAFAQVATNALFFTTMTIVNANYDPTHVFIVFAAFSTVSALALIGAPSYRTSADTEEQYSAGGSKFSPMVRQVLLGFGLYSIALFMLFPYVENIGVNHGFSHSQVAAVLVFSCLAALGGPVVTAILGRRLGWFIPVIIVVGIQSCACLILVYSNVLPVWGGTELTSIAMLYVLTPLMFSFAAHIDNTGRATAIATGIMAVAAAGGTAFSSFVMAQSSSYVALGWCNAAVYVLMAATLWGPLRAADGAQILNRGRQAPIGFPQRDPD